MPPLHLHLPHSDKPLRIRRYRLRMRPRSIPLFWVPLSVQGFRSCREQQEWILLLSARHLPFFLQKGSGTVYCFVPALLHGIALQEFQLYQQEEAHRRDKTRKLAQGLPPVRKGWPWAMLAVLPLICMHAWRNHLLPAIPGLPSPALWENLGSLDSVRLYVYHEGYRCLTALFLHGDAAHLYSNVMLSAVALAVVARSLGTGRTWLLTLLGGTLGNAIALLFRTPPYVSTGFSTAFFALIGLLCGQAPSWRGNAFLPLLAGIGLLALLGTDGVRVDYAGHIGGLLAGFALGIWERFRERHHIPALPGFLAGLLAMAFGLGGWSLALKV